MSSHPTSDEKAVPASGQRVVPASDEKAGSKACPIDLTQPLNRPATPEGQWDAFVSMNPYLDPDRKVNSEGVRSTTDPGYHDADLVKTILEQNSLLQTNYEIALRRAECLEKLLRASREETQRLRDRLGEYRVLEGLCIKWGDILKTERNAVKSESDKDDNVAKGG